MVAVLIYIFYTDIWEDIFPLLLSIKDDIHIDIALCSDNDNSKIINDLKQLNIINIRYVENRGGDIGPFLLQIQDLDEDKYPYFIKIHSKKSIIAKFDWKYILFNSLIGSKEILEKNTSLLHNNKNIGAITDPTLIMTNIGKNKLYIDILAKLLNISTTKKRFMAGSMFMSRTELFKKYFTKNFIDAIYPLLETGKVSDSYNATYCHSLERIFGQIVSNENLQIGHIQQKPYITIYNKLTQSTFSLYKCYNNYCYTKSKKAFIFGYLYPVINDDESIVINWTYMKQYDNYFKRYDKQTNGLYIGVS
jgi:hypothetical protein